MCVHGPESLQQAHLHNEVYARAPQNNHRQLVITGSLWNNTPKIGQNYSCGNFRSKNETIGFMMVVEITLPFGEISDYKSVLIFLTEVEQ